MPTTPHVSVERLPFSRALRERSWSQHRQAGGASFISDLAAGRVSRDGYTAMVTQHLFIYDALESVATLLRHDPLAGPFVSDQLTRLPSIRTDLAALGAPAEPFALASTRAYADRIRATTTWPAGFVAHHYTRYLGDLSGGMAIGTIAARVYGLVPGGDGVRFYQFDEIPQPKRFKDEYRARLDATPWTSEEHDEIIAEVLVAYQLNTAMLDELARLHPSTA